ncbi:hypothetical protein J668_3669 [Acinetobacter baumannii 1276470-86]|uniref:hypothetical protein n=1 Tax=Acinetobacter baumannii TaxID=470 RepID=UPI000447CD60|nr:hypothetical protein [Acinetobacter baumannii]EXH14071.1 hypothetical protein J636_3649 [Acinetobacter baumannii 1271213]EXR35546.1 hypothetical protein J668_3669 [Acinetobacter baumannii 1276470-86]
MSELYSSQAVKDVLNERERQIIKEGYLPEFDNLYEGNELPRAASCYVDHAVSRGWVYSSKDFGPEVYMDEDAAGWGPFADTFWKPKSPRQDLVRAAALLIAEIERLDREVKAESKEG